MRTKVGEKPAEGKIFLKKNGYSNCYFSTKRKFENYWHFFVMIFTSTSPKHPTSNPGLTFLDNDKWIHNFHRE